jgi:DNA-binding NarL/FixJ family response regulator
MANIRVLIVDDTERVRQDLRTFLTLAGKIEVIGEASNGLESIQLVKTLAPQVVLMDLEMPVMDGYEATRQIKALQPSCRVIALTIHGEETEQKKALDAGMDAFVIKGAPMEMLMKAICSAPILGQMPEGDKDESYP